MTERELELVSSLTHFSCLVLAGWFWLQLFSRLLLADVEPVWLTHASITNLM